MNYEKLLEIAISAAMRAGTSLMDNYRQTIPIDTKESARDVATAVDRLAEQEVFAVLRGFDERLPILSEEHGMQGQDTGAGHWVVDALDGTVNYLQQVPFFCASIAYVVAGEPVVGVVYAPLVDDIYYGAKGVGVFKNQHKIKTPDRAPHESLFSVTFSGKSHDPAHRLDEFALFAEVNDQSRGCLRTGSAALNLAYLAEGRFNGCWGKANKEWDISAGLLLAQLAGAQVLLACKDANLHLFNYLAAPPRNFAWLQPRVQSLFGAAGVQEG